MKVQRDDVVHCYRHLLGRDPESEAVIAEKLSVHTSLWHLIDSIIASPEFRQRVDAAMPPLRVDVPPLDIDVDVSPSDLEQLRDHVQKSWEKLGETQAHFSVLTAPAFLPDRFADNAAAFWATGDAQVRWLIRILTRHGMDALDRKTCIDFGCGVGRLTGPLADRFASVHGYDISNPHLDLARQHLTGRTNVELHLVRSVPPTLEPCDVFFSLIVLQHNPPPIIALLIRSALQSLKPGGIAVFQVPTYHVGYGFSVSRYLNTFMSKKLDMEMHCLPQSEIFRIARETKCQVLEVREQDMTNRWGKDVSNVFAIRADP